MSSDAPTVPAQQSVGELIRAVAGQPHSCFYVVGGEQQLAGVIVLEELRRSLPNVEVAGALVARDLARRDLSTLSPEQDLDTVMRIFAGKNREELLKRDMVSELSNSLVATTTEEVSLGGDFQMAEIDAPGDFVGRSIRKLDIRARFGAQVLLLRRPAPNGEQELELIPEPDTIVARGDRLVLVARAAALRRLRAL